MRRKDFFMGKWLKRSSGYPTWFGRLARVGHIWVEREINEEYHTSGEIRCLTNHIHHFPFSKGIQFWIDRHNRYSSMEALARVVENGRNINYWGLFRKDPMIRRKAAKQMLYRLPFRPILAFGYLLFLRGGVFDGAAGISFAILRAIYEYMIDLKTLELRRQKQGLPI
jgi:hypothetical protein